MTLCGLSHARNLLTNGSFENDMNGWWTGVSGNAQGLFSIETADASSGGKSLKIEITRPGSQAWDIQAIHNEAWPSVPNREYTLTFYGKAIGTNASIRLVQQLDDAYLAIDQSLTPEWKQYAWTFTATTNNLQFKIHFPGEGIFLLDDFILTGDVTGEPLLASVDASVVHQTMVGFGGALTWHCDRITRSSHKDAIAQLLFKDLGADIIRLKNWYYPQGYPQNKEANVFHVDWFKPHFEATRELRDLAKSYNPSVEVLLSNWGPPASLKSNNKLEEGALGKNTDGSFKYDDFAQYMVDVLDHIGFDPEYLSIQNEPGYENPGWTTCGWRPEESSDYPSYAKGLDAVYEKIKNRSRVPMLIGPETENIGDALWNNTQNTFGSMAESVKNKNYLAGYAYHLYNYGSPASINTGYLNLIKNQYSDKPAFMTEFSSGNFDWLQTAHMIQLNLMEANAAAYVYWDMMWDENSEVAMITVDNNGEYTVLPYYYTIKHFAKHIDKGYSRIEVSGSNSQVKITGFKNADGTKYSFVLTNNTAAEQAVTLEVPRDWNIIHEEAFQSVEDNYYYELTDIDIGELNLPAKSITTLSVIIDDSPVTSTSNALKSAPVQRSYELFPVPASDHMTIKTSSGDQAIHWEISSMQGIKLKSGHGNEVSVSELNKGVYLIRINGEISRFIKK